MAPFITSSQVSDELIDIRKVAHSSPPAAGAAAQVEASLEFVEDSFKDPSKGGPVKTPPPRNHDVGDGDNGDNDDDELYSLSPQRKKAHKKLQSATKPSSRSGSRWGAVDLAETNKDAQLSDPASRTSSKAIGASRAVDDLFKNGAIAHKDNSNKETTTLSGAAGKNGRRDAAASSNAIENDEEFAHIPRQKAAQGKKGRIMPPADNVSKPPGRPKDRQESRNAPTEAPSALAALRARRNGQDLAKLTRATTTRTSTPVPAPKPKNATASTRPALQEKSKNIRTPAKRQEQERQSSKPPTTGKLTSRKDRMLTNTPRTAPAPLRPDKSDDAARERRGENGNRVSRGLGRAQDMPESTKTSLKPPSKSQGNPKATRTSTYDLPVSSEEDETVEPTKKSRASKATATKPPSKHTSKRDNEAEAGSSKKTKAKASQNPAKKDDATLPRLIRKPGSTRAKMKATSDIATQGPAGSQPSDTGADPYFESRRKTGKDDRSTKRDWESVEEFERSVFDFGNDDFEDGVEKTTVPPPRSNKQDLSSVAFQNIKRDPDRMSHGRDRTQSARHGASDRNPIVLSDREDSSSMKAPTPRKDQVFSNVSPHQARDRSRHRPPKTPVLYPSSPPVKEYQTAETSVSKLVDEEAARRPTIISFGKNGPLNQGSVSAKKKVPGPAPWSRSSLVAATEGLGSEFSSRARLETKRKHGPSSVATSRKSARTDRSAPPNNVAETVADALAGFMKKPTTIDDKYGTLQEGKPSIPSVDTSKQIDQGNHDNDDFHLVDDFDGPTLVEPDRTRDLTPKPNSPTKRTASQLAMPPPPPRPAKTKNMDRAPTVPQMLPVNVESDVSSLKPDGAVKSSKRAIEQINESEGPAEPPSKRSRMELFSHGRDDAASGRSAATQDIEAGPPQPARTPQREQTLERMKRGARKPSRVPSRSSQTSVDIRGSPVPEGLTVPLGSSALGGLLNQHGISSDHYDKDPIVTGRAVARSKTYPSMDKSDALPAPTQRLLFQDTQLQSAGLLKGSDAFPESVSDELNRSIVVNDAGMSQPNPFISSDANRMRPSQAFGAKPFRERLDEMTSYGNVEVVEDPEKTLLESEQPLRKSKRTSSFSTLSSSENSAEADETTESQRDRETWRNGLQPYQLNLFDELENIHHRLSRHIIDGETAALEIAGDYRRRCLQIVETMESAHAEQYEEYVATLNQRKKQLRKDLKRCTNKLNEGIASMKAMQKEHVETVKSKDNVVENLQKLMDDYC